MVDPTDIAASNTPQPGPLDADRARLIGSIYEVVLRPEHFDTFMQDWSAYIEQAAQQLVDIRQSQGTDGDVLNDPTIEDHFQRAFALFERMGRGDAAVALGVAGPEPLARVIRADRVRDASARAKTLFGDPVSLSGICDALDPDSATRLQGFLSGVERAPASGRFVVLSLAGDLDQTEGGLPGGGLIAAVTCRDPTGDGFVTELRPLTIEWTPGLAAILTESFALTPRELDLVRELTQGGDLPAIAARVGKSQNTLRAQLKSVFAKTRTKAQSELMRLVSVLVLHRPPTEPTAPSSNETQTEIRVDLGHGRFLPVHLAGVVNDRGIDGAMDGATNGSNDDFAGGLPVVFVHGMLDGLGVLRVNGPAFRAAGVRVIAPVRANFGQAMPESRLKDAPDIFARDLGVVLDRLGIGRCILCGHMAGSVSAFAAAARLGDRVAGVVSVSGCVPIKSVEQFATMTPRQRAMAYTARFAPALLPAVLRAAIAYIDSRDVRRFMVPLYAPDSADRRIIDTPDIAEALIQGYRFTVAQGPGAFLSDSWQVTRDWSAMSARSSCPVLLIHATQDPVISLSSVRGFAQTSARFTVHEIPDHGQLVFYSNPGAVLSAVAGFARTHLSTP